MKARKTFRKPRIALVLLVVLVSTSAIVAAQTPAPSSRVNQVDAQDDVIRVDTNLVTIPASVMDREGRYVTDLKKEDFQIFEDGVEQEVSLFAPVEQPFTILFLLDMSGSMTYRIDDLARSANAFVGQLRPDDRLIVVSFDDWVEVLFEAKKVGDLRKNIKLRLRPSPPTTMIYDAVDYALRRVKKIRGRKAIVLFSDGVGSGMFASAKRNLRDAEELGALIYTVQFDTYPAEPSRYVDRKEYIKQIEEANNYMRDLAQKTGGRHYWVESISNLDETFDQVADELRRQYSLGYYPKTKPERGQRRQVKVKVRPPNLVVRARDSYIVESSKKTR